MAERRFVVREIIIAMSWCGTAWAVGCKTKEGALHAFDRRLARNLLIDNPATVVVYDRKTRKLICWTSDVTDPKIFVRDWCH